MKILVRAKPGAKKDLVVPPQPRLFENGPATQKASQDEYVVFTKEKPVDGKANEAIARLLAEHFGVKRVDVELISGATSRKKIFNIR